MAVTLTGTGGLFTRLGKIIKGVRAVNGFLGASAPAAATTWGAGGPTVAEVKTIYDGLAGQYQSTEQSLVDGLRSQENSFRANQSSALTYLQSLAQNTVIEMVHADAPLPSKTIALALAELIEQMEASGDTVKANDTGVTVTAGSGNVGDAQLVVTTLGNDGAEREYLLAETMVAKVATDSLTGGTAGAESVQVLGTVAQTNKLAYDWPKGSGASVTLTMVNPALDATRNLLTNSDFEDFAVANTPDKWATLVGTNGTSILKQTASVHGGAAALQFVGDGSELTSVAQTFNTSGGTLGALLPGTSYAFCIYFRTSSATPAAGAFALDLVNSSNAVINDDAGNANTVTRTLTTATTSYQALTGTFRTPTNLPSTYKLRLRLSTALTTGVSVYFDDLALAAMTDLYGANGRGPMAAIFRGATDVLRDDSWDVAVTNDRAGVFQTYAEILFSMRQLGLQLPSDGTPTIAESLTL